MVSKTSAQPREPTLVSCLIAVVADEERQTQRSVSVSPTLSTSLDNDLLLDPPPPPPHSLPVSLSRCGNLLLLETFSTDTLRLTIMQSHDSYRDVKMMRCIRSVPVPLMFHQYASQASVSGNPADALTQVLGYIPSVDLCSAPIMALHWGYIIWGPWIPVKHLHLADVEIFNRIGVHADSSMIKACRTSPLGFILWHHEPSGPNFQLSTFFNLHQSDGTTAQQIILLLLVLYRWYPQCSLTFMKISESLS